jgi:hypothetical protein
MFNNSLYRLSSSNSINFYELLRGGVFDKEAFKRDYLESYGRYQISEKMIDGLDFLLSYPQIINDLSELKNTINNNDLDIKKIIRKSTTIGPSLYSWFFSENKSLNESENKSLYEYQKDLKRLKIVEEIISNFDQNEDKYQFKVETYNKALEEVEPLRSKVENYRKELEEFKNGQNKIEGHEWEKIYQYCSDIVDRILNVIGKSNVKYINYFMKEIPFFKPLLFRISPKVQSPNTTRVSSKYFDDFNLQNSSNSERRIFTSLERLGLHAIPAGQKGAMSLLDENGDKFGFRIDFLLPCNVREYDGENYSLRQDIIFVGEYFGYYGADYDAKKSKKINWQNNFEKSLDQRCLHIDDKSNLCDVLKEKNIDCKCYPDFNGHLFNINNDAQRKIFYIKSQIQNFIYVFLVSELLWHINYDYSLNTIENLNKVKEKNKKYFDRFNDLISNVNDYKPSELAMECGKILNTYRNKFTNEKFGKRMIMSNQIFNNRKNSSII